MKEKAVHVLSSVALVVCLAPSSGAAGGGKSAAASTIVQATPLVPTVPVPRALMEPPPAEPAVLVESEPPAAEEERPLVVEGRLTDSRRRRLTGTFLLHFRLREPGEAGREAWSASRYVPVSNGIYFARIALPKPFSSHGIPEGYRMEVSPPEGTGWMVRDLPYLVQAGSYTEPERAQKALAELEDEFANVYIARGEVDGVSRFQVRLGPFERRREAEDIAWWLKSTGRDALVLLAD